MRSLDAKIKYRIVVVSAVLFFFAVFAKYFFITSFPSSQEQEKSSSAQATYLGSQACASCHAAQFDAWQHSQHAHSMQHANQSTVLGDFNNAYFNYNGVVTTFFRRGEKFFVNTDGPDGQLHDYEIRYTFGVAPLQQYLIEFADGRVQALLIAWDTRPREQGGQRWFHLYPEQKITARDSLHWTQRNQNWNFMCAECHSTQVRKNYDAVADRFATQWSEISVGCEACHGPASLHVERARGGHYEASSNGLLVHFPVRAHWIRDSDGKPQRAAPRAGQTEIDTCGICHSRRAQITEGFVAGQTLLDTHQLSLLDANLFDADGQMRDEVYNVASFLQSKMYAKGVSCGDCHEPHNGQLRAQGNAVCTQCHAPQQFDTFTHHHHRENSAGARCVACHMPQRTYMQIDVRHDHNFRIPRPDLSQQLHTDNTCNACHRDKNSAWAAQAVEHWFGSQRKGFQQYAPVFAAARAEQLDAPKLLLQLAADNQQPAIARATAYAELASYVTPSSLTKIAQGLRDDEALVRLGAVRSLRNVPLPQRWNLLAPLLSDPVRSVRIEVAPLLAAMLNTQLPANRRAQWESVIAEYIAAQQLNADRPEARINLGALYAERGDAAAAEREYRAALKLAPDAAAAVINLSDLYARQNKENEAENLLRSSLVNSSNDASLHHALALSLVRRGDLTQALAQFAQAVKLDPKNVSLSYAYGVALHDAGKVVEALQLLKKNYRLHPSDRATLIALISYCRERGDMKSAAVYEQRLLKTP